MRTIYDTVIVGGGIAGLTAAVYLSIAGQKVLLIEKNNEFGGLVNTFERDGFRFEAGVRALENAGVIFPMLNDLGIKLEVVKSKVSIGVEKEVLHIEDMNSIALYQELLVRLYPECEKEIVVFIRKLRTIMKHLDVLYSVENPLFKNLKKDWDYLFRKLLPWLPKFLFTVGVVNYLNKPVENYLRGFMLNQSLIDIISQHFFRGTPTFFALSYFSLYLDYFYPKGGVGKLAESLVEKMGEYHGELLPNTTIEKVCIRNKRVADSQGNDYHFHNLIWASDLKAFYQSVNSDDLDENVKSKFEVEKLKVLQKKGAESVFTLFLEVDLPLDYFRNISHGHFFYTPSKIGLNETHTTELDALMTNWRQVRKEDVLNWLDRFLRLNTFEISIPGLKDETLVPLGKTGLIISFLSRFEIFRIIQEDGWYVEFRNAIEEKLIDRVCL